MHIIYTLYKIFVSYSYFIPKKLITKAKFRNIISISSS